MSPTETTGGVDSKMNGDQLLGGNPKGVTDKPVDSAEPLTTGSKRRQRPDVLDQMQESVDMDVAAGGSPLIVTDGAAKQRKKRRVRLFVDDEENHDEGGGGGEVKKSSAASEKKSTGHSAKSSTVETGTSQSPKSKLTSSGRCMRMH